MIAFGPVPSRRLGRSLGINNIPPKICRYSGIVAERLGKAHLGRSGPRDEWYADRMPRKAMDHYEKAEAAGASGGHDPILRWNTCSRTLARRGRPSQPTEPERTVLTLE